MSNNQCIRHSGICIRCFDRGLSRHCTFCVEQQSAAQSQTQANSPKWDRMYEL